MKPKSKSYYNNIVLVLIVVYLSTHAHTHTHRYVAPRRVVSAVLNTIPVRTGALKLVVRFTSDQLTNVMGDEDVEVL